MNNRRVLLLIFLFTLSVMALAQETVLNVPNVEVLDRGKVYVELDTFTRPTEPTAAIAPRIVVGVGRNVELGANLVGPAVPEQGQYTLSPTAKWRFYNDKQNGWSAVLGENLFIPVRQRHDNLGSYTYLQVAKRFGQKTRLGVGGYHFSRDVVDRAQRAGAQLSVEQNVSRTVTLAADWYSGRHANGYLTSGIAWNMTKKFTTYAAYQVGNDTSRGNHGLLIEFGYNF